MVSNLGNFILGVRFNAHPTVCYTHTLYVFPFHTQPVAQLCTLTAQWGSWAEADLSSDELVCQAVCPWMGPLEVLQALKTPHVQNWAKHPPSSSLICSLSCVPPTANDPSSSLSSKPELWPSLWTPPLFPSLHLIYRQVLMMFLSLTLTSHSYSELKYVTERGEIEKVCLGQATTKWKAFEQGKRIACTREMVRKLWFECGPKRGSRLLMTGCHGPGGSHRMRWAEEQSRELEWAQVGQVCE